MHDKKADLTEGDVKTHLWNLSMPMVWGIGAIISFQLVDTYYISLLGTDELAAMSFTFPITFIVYSVIMGFSIALASVVARLIGEGRTDDVRRVTTHGIALVALVSLTMSVLGILFSDRIFEAMGAAPHIRELIHQFMHTWFAGGVFISVPMVGNAAFRAAGDSKTPAIIMVTVAIANAVLAPIFIFGLFGMPRLELFGAALTTVIANACAMFAGLYFLAHKYRVVAARYLTNWLGFGDSCRRLLPIAMPAALTNVLPPLVNGYITKLLATSGAGAVAAFGIATRIEALIFIPVMAAAIGMAPIIGQNFGARKLDRVRTVLGHAINFNIVWSLAMAMVLAILARPLAGVFSTDPEVVHVATMFFLIVPISYACGNLLNGWSSAFNAMGMPIYSFWSIVLKMIVIMVPAVTIAHHLAGIPGLFVAIMLVNIVTGVVVHVYGMRMCLQKQNKAASTASPAVETI